ncbi:hypothetical protein LLH00_10160 [bacterium]|nr:hypothetical protein [bacterium]
MEFNILKLAFLLGYLSLLVCVVSGIPFLTALFRSVLVTVIFSLLGFFIRLFLLRLVNSVESRIASGFEEPSGPGFGEETPQAGETEEEMEFESAAGRGSDQ